MAETDSHWTHCAITQHQDQEDGLPPINSTCLRQTNYIIGDTDFNKHFSCLTEGLWGWKEGSVAPPGCLGWAGGSSSGNSQESGITGMCHQVWPITRILQTSHTDRNHPVGLPPLHCALLHHPPPKQDQFSLMLVYKEESTRWQRKEGSKGSMKPCAPENVHTRQQQKPGKIQVPELWHGFSLFPWC